MTFLAAVIGVLILLLVMELAAYFSLTGKKEEIIIPSITTMIIPMKGK